MDIRLLEVTEINFWDVIHLKSDKEQEQRIQLFERWVGSNAFFLGACQVYKFLPKAIYDGDILIGFTCFGYRNEHKRYELISIMLGHQFQGKGYGVPILKKVVDEMIQLFDCKEIYLTVIHNNEPAKRIYEKIGFKPTGEIVKAHHDEWVYCLKLAD